MKRPPLADTPADEVLLRAAELRRMAGSARPAKIQTLLLRSAERLEQYVLIHAASQPTLDSSSRRG